MKLEEIRQRFKDLAQMRIGETVEEHSTRYWEDLPRMPFKDMPLSLQQEARKRHTPDTIRQFLQECYQQDDFDAEIPPEDLDKILIRTRNTAIYTIEKVVSYEASSDTDQIQFVPVLYGNHATEAFEAAVLAYRERQEEKHEKEEKHKQKGTHTPSTPARAGNLVSAGYYQYVISDPQYQHALTPQKNENAYIALMTPDFFQRLDFSQDAGALTYNKETAGVIKQYRKGKYEDIKNLDFPLLTQVYTAAIKAQVRHDAYTITVSMPDFFREMGISMGTGNAPDVLAKLHSFENCVGIMPGSKTVSKLFSIIEYDMKNETMTFAVPYIIRLYEVLEVKNHVKRTTRTGEALEYTLPFHNSLVHSTIASERNKTAVELVYLITNGLLQRGTVPDVKTYRMKGAKTLYPDRITYSISFRSLIKEAPLLRGRINSYEDVSNKNSALRRAFKKAYQLIDTKTDAAEWFINLHFDRVIPTMTTLDDELTITHDGKNGDYKRKK